MAARGKWQGRTLLDEAFMAQATRQHSDGGWPMEGASYGYLWWIAPHGFFASGFGEQFLVVEPGRRLIAAVNSHNGRASKHVRRIFDEHVLGRVG